MLLNRSPGCYSLDIVRFYDRTESTIGRKKESALSFIRNASITFATRITLFIVGLTSSVLVARLLGPEGKGLLSLVVLTGSVLFTVVNLGVGTGTGYFLGRKKVPLDKLAGNWLSLSVLIGLVVLVVSQIFAPAVVSRFLPSVPLWAVRLALITVPFTIVSYNLQMLFKAKGDFHRFNLIDLVQPVLFLVIFVSAVIFASGGTLEEAVYSYVFSALMPGIVAVALVSSIVKLRFRWDGEIVKPAMRFGVQGYIAGFLGFLNYRIDMFLVNLYMEPRFVGYYSISVMIAEKLWYLPNVLAAVLYPRVAHSDEENANIDTSRVSRLTVFLIGLSCLLILVVGRVAIRFLYSDRFLPAVKPLFYLLPGIFAMSLAKVVSSDLLARGFPRVNMIAGFTAFVANVLFNMYLIPRSGISGAAIASTISYSLFAAVVLVSFVRITGVSLWNLLIPKAEDFSAMFSRLRR
ncbi:hypothetical protein DRQ05_04915 [bacterium]|nr:MAG: hypothetical protein DRQ05_04915 [bacterium]